MAGQAIPLQEPIIHEDTEKRELPVLSGQIEGMTTEKAEVLDQLPTPVMVVDSEFTIRYMNDIGLDWLEMGREDVVGSKCYDLFNTPHCNTPNCRMRGAMETEKVTTSRNELNVYGRTIPIEYTATPVKDQDGNVVGGVEYIDDITETVEAEEAMRQYIEEISTPVIKLWEGVLMVPLVGTVDTARASQMLDALLDAVTTNDARVVVLDVTGVSTIDTSVARHLMTTVAAVKILGAEIIITGFSPHAAQTLTHLGVDFASLRTRGSLRAGVKEAISLVGDRIAQH